MSAKNMMEFLLKQQKIFSISWLNWIAPRSRLFLLFHLVLNSNSVKARMPAPLCNLSKSAQGPWPDLEICCPLQGLEPRLPYSRSLRTLCTLRKHYSFEGWGGTCF